MLKVTNLHASVDGKEILRGINLEVKAGEVIPRCCGKVMQEM